MSGSNNDLARALSDHLTKTFNIRAWDESDTRNNGRLLCATGYQLTALSGGRTAVIEEAEGHLLSLGHEVEGGENPNPMMQARNDARQIAAVAIAFCRGPKGLH
jgi:hypothetical protein